MILVDRLVHFLHFSFLFLSPFPLLGRRREGEKEEERERKRTARPRCLHDTGVIRTHAPKWKSISCYLPFFMVSFTFIKFFVLKTPSCSSFELDSTWFFVMMGFVTLHLTLWVNSELLILPVERATSPVVRAMACHRRVRHPFTGKSCWLLSVGIRT